MAKNIEQQYQYAKETYASIGVDTEKAIEALKKIKISLHCWQGDDVTGLLEKEDLSGGISVTGNYPGKARNGEELRQDLNTALSMIPGKHKLNLHAIYAETDEKVSIDKLKPEHFSKWISWAKENGMGLDFNPTCFSHPMFQNGFSVSHPDKEVRDFWIRHCKASRKISEAFGKELGQTCVTNFWFPDGYKDIPDDKLGPRRRMKESLDEIFAEEIDPKYNLDAVESKLFGIGVESYVVGSNEFCMGYALKNDKLLCLDAGHFHPTEVISDKISAVSLYDTDILLHVSRPVRWDSDHVVIMDNELKAIAHEIVTNGLAERVHIGLDYFDATINRIAAWVIGSRNMLKALLIALLEPRDILTKAEAEFDYTTRLAMQEEIKSYPFNAVWDYYCNLMGVPVQAEWLAQVKKYEEDVLSKRS